MDFRLGKLSSLMLKLPNCFLQLLKAKIPSLCQGLRQQGTEYQNSLLTLAGGLGWLLVIREGIRASLLSRMENSLWMISSQLSPSDSSSMSLLISLTRCFSSSASPSFWRIKALILRMRQTRARTTVVQMRITVRLIKMRRMPRRVQQFQIWTLRQVDAEMQMSEQGQAPSGKGKGVLSTTKLQLLELSPRKVSKSMDSCPKLVRTFWQLSTCPYDTHDKRARKQVGLVVYGVLVTSQIGWRDVRKIVKVLPLGGEGVGDGMIEDNVGKGVKRVVSLVDTEPILVAAVVLHKDVLLLHGDFDALAQAQPKGHQQYTHSILPSLYPTMSMLTDFNYAECQFEARLQKPNAFRLRRKEQFYLYVSPEYIIINREPYSKKPEIILKLLPTTHVKWLWEHRKGKPSLLKGFIIQTEGYMNEFIAERIVLETLKSKFKEIALQSDFYDEYVLGHYIDKGNYAQVYQCTRKDNSQKFAVKILEKERLTTMKNGKESVFNELKILRNLKHDNLMRLFEVFEDRNKFYIILELLDGITLYKEIQTRRKNNQLKAYQIRGIIRQILKGLQYLHSRNIMHRDIKPENILFEHKGSLDEDNAEHGLKLVDYGLATFQHQKTVIFTKCGTPGFVAPEIITYDEKQPIYQTIVDVFSVGVILHILLVGEQSFPARSRQSILNKNKECRIDFKAKKYEGIASDGIDLLSKMLEKTPEKRITASQALRHPFLTMDRAIFKFKKSQAETRDIKLVPMKMYRNFEDFEEEAQSPTKMAGNPDHTFTSTFDDSQNYFAPFSYEHENINLNLINKIPNLQSSKPQQGGLKFKELGQEYPKNWGEYEELFMYQ